MKQKIVKYYFHDIDKHWVGNGFHVHGLLRESKELNSLVSPFVMLDYASPKNFEKSSEIRGVGEHPHRGFETVTFAYKGEIEHKDSSGGGGVISQGDVQWMTAGSGIVHNEYHSKNFTSKGGVFEMVQLWVNLPQKFKMTKPKYQSIKKDSIPSFNLTSKSRIRVIAGSYGKALGPANTYTKINIFEIYSKLQDKININIERNTNTILLILNGSIIINEVNYNKESLLVFDNENSELIINTSNDFKGLILNGTPINEPIVSYGPFVMNSKDEINQAIIDYNNGKMGNL